MERWLSGLKRLPAKQESGKPGARVRIPLSPPAYAKASAGAASFLNETLNIKKYWQQGNKTVYCNLNDSVRRSFMRRRKAGQNA